MFQATLEKTLTQMLGEPVTVGKFNLYPLAGTLQIEDLRVGDELLHVRQISGRLTMSKLLSKQISLRTLSIEGVTLRWGKKLWGNVKEKSGKSGPTSWRVDAAEILLRDGVVEYPAKKLRAAHITADMRGDGADMRYHLDIGQVKIGRDIVNVQPIHFDGVLRDVENLLDALGAKLQVNVKLEMDLKKLFN